MDPLEETFGQTDANLGTVALYKSTVGTDQSNRQIETTEEVPNTRNSESPLESFN